MGDDIELRLGTRRAGADPSGEGESLSIPPAALLRHVMALGSSGSGKTVFAKGIVEEAIRLGIPAICVDPQGDIGSLGDPGDRDAWAAHGVPTTLAEAYAEQVDLVVFSPTSDAGIPVSADPIEPGWADEKPAERQRAISRMAANLTSLLGFDLDADDGAGMVAVVEHALSTLHDEGRAPARLDALTRYLLGLEGDALAPYTRFVRASALDTARRRLARLDVGARRLLFHHGVPLDIDTLLGRGAGAVPGRVRISVIHLNALPSQEDKQFFVAALADRLYGWMLRNPDPAPQALFYIDEVAPFVPPVKKPACKPALQLLFKQARKYGVGCLMATQNPGDVDYKAMAQFGSWAIGRLTTRQDLKKIEPTVKALAPAGADSVMATLPRQEPGEFVLLSPDHFAKPALLRARWLYSDHRTLTDDDIEARMDPLRVRFADAMARPTPAEAEPTGGRARDEDSPAGTPGDAEPPRKERRREADATVAIRRSRGGNAAPRARGREADVTAPQRVRHPDTRPDQGDATSTFPDELPERMRTAEKPTRSDSDGALLGLLAARGDATAKEFAEYAGISEGRARTTLKRFVAEGRAEAFKDGRSQRYWTRSGGGRPDLGMPRELPVAVPKVDGAAIVAEAEKHATPGSDELVHSVTPVYRLLYRVHFEERVKPGVLGRLFGSEEEHRAGSVYFDARSLALLVCDAKGTRFVAQAPARASEVDDLDGVVDWVARGPADVELHEADWTNRASEEAVRERFSALFDAIAGTVSPVLVPLHRWCFERDGGAGYRYVLVDGWAGRRIRWPED